MVFRPSTSFDEVLNRIHEVTSTHWSSKHCHCDRIISLSIQWLKPGHYSGGGGVDGGNKAREQRTRRGKRGLPSVVKATKECDGDGEAYLTDDEVFRYAGEFLGNYEVPQADLIMELQRDLDKVHNEKKVMEHELYSLKKQYEKPRGSTKQHIAAEKAATATKGSRPNKERWVVQQNRRKNKRAK